MSTPYMPQVLTDPPPEPDAFASLTLAVTGLHRQMQQHQRAQEATAAAPIYAPRQKSGIVLADGTLRLELGGPAMGRRWVVRNVAICDAAAVRTATTGTADLYVANPSILGPGGWRWPFAALPAAERFSDDEILVIPHDHLVVLVQGATAGQNLMARASVLDFPIVTPSPVVSL